MFTRPADLRDRDVWRAIERGWNLTIDRFDYAPVGFGSHHWYAEAQGVRWFVTVDDLDARLIDGSDHRATAQSRLVAALSTVRSLADTGAEYAIAPIRSMSGSVVEPIDNRYVVAVYPHVEGRVGDNTDTYRTSTERHQVIDMLAQLHQTDGAEMSARVDDLAIPRRHELVVSLSETDTPWDSGPFGERARLLLRQYGSAVGSLLSHFDGLVGELRDRSSSSLALTHGEPHPGNVIFTPGGPVLIDWDTALLAHRERDLWALLDQDTQVRSQYETVADRQINDTALDAYRIWWDLCEIALFTYEFRQPHETTADSETAWTGFVTHLDPARWTNDI